MVEQILAMGFFTGKRFSLSNSIFIDEKVSFSNSVFNVDIMDMNNIIFGKGVKDFSSCRFNGGEINFHGVSFAEGTLDFKVVRIANARISFSGSVFDDGYIDFSFSSFSQEGIDFSGVQFSDLEIIFRNSNFNNGNILFFGTTFGKGQISFGGAKMGNASVDFSYSKYSDCEIRFRHTDFGFGNLNFNNLVMEKGKMIFESNEFKGKKLSFANSVINELNFDACNFIEHVDMSVECVEKLIVNNCIIEKTFDLASSYNRNVCIKQIYFLHTKNLGQIDIDWSNNDVLNMINSQGDATNYQDKANQFRLLKENFRNLGRYNDEDAAYLAFKRCESKSIIHDEYVGNEKKKKFDRTLQKIIYPFKILILDYIGQYATNPFRIIGAMFISIVFFALLYIMPFVVIQGEKELFEAVNSSFVNALTKALYHSIATNFTIGYGDVNPGNFAAMILSGVQGFLGLFFMSYFTVAFVRKILR